MGDHTRNFGVVDSSFCFSSSFSFCPSLSLSLSLHSLSFFFAIFFFFSPPFSSLLPSLAFYSPLHHFFFIFLFLLFSTLLSYTSLPILSSYFLPYTPLVALSRSPTPTYSQNPRHQYFLKQNRTPSSKSLTCSSRTSPCGTVF